ncbi:Cytoplasm to vacuole targeting protein [Ceraceosorus bombacis]|uniref:Autophagy-related protein 2 n=1 Tax=Ceraceosorus bombacis TaxID=401625 RepID=A0A0P1BGT9_9BASI|nr:Cytoplasm to vacuole targeting protein [Ceraceosorus bombacis]
MWSGIPALLGQALASLPGLPIAGAWSISAALQRRLLSYLVRRTLGHLLKPGSLDGAQIDAGIGSGKLEIAHLELDKHAVNELLGPLPVRLASATLGLVALQLPALSNLWAGEVLLKVADVNLQLDLCPKQEAYGPASASSLSENGHSELDAKGLEASILSAAESMLSVDPEGEQLQRDLANSVLEDSAGPSTPEPAVSAVAGSMSSSMVENLLSRLKVQVASVRIGVQNQPEGKDELNERICLEARVDAIAFSSSAGPLRAAGTNLEDPMTFVQDLSRSAAFEGVSIWLDAESTSSNSARKPSPRNSSASSDSSNDARSEGGFMEMSQATHDVRHGMGLSTASVGASMYASAHEQHEVSVDEARSASPMGTSSASSRLKRTRPLSVELPGPQMIIKLDDPHIAAEFVSPRCAQIDRATAARAGLLSPSEHDTGVLGNMERLGSQSSLLSLRFGTLAAYTSPLQLASLLVLCSQMRTAFAATSQAQQRPPTKPSNSQGLQVSVKVPHVQWICAYESPDGLGAADRQEFASTLDSYWQRPNRAHPFIGHVRLHVSDVAVSLAPNTDEAEIAAGDLMASEHLSPSLWRAAQSRGHSPACIVPLLLVDLALQHQYEVPSGSSGSTAGGDVSESAPSTMRHNLSIDTLDWRSSESRHEEPKHRNPFWRTSWGDRAWKLRPGRRNTQSQVTFANQRILSETRSAPVPAIQAKVSGLDVRVTLAPIHLFADLSLAGRLGHLFRIVAVHTQASKGSDDTMQEDLGLSIATLQPPSPSSDRIPNVSSDQRRPHFGLNCQIFRVSLRVPSGNAEPLDAGIPLRAGLLTLDIHDINAQAPANHAASDAAFAQNHAQPRDQPERDSGMRTEYHDLAQCTIGHLVTFVMAPSEAQATMLLSIGRLGDDCERAQGSTKPDISQPMRISVQQPSASKSSVIDVVVPSIEGYLTKPVFDSLVLLLDDLSQWSSSLGESTQWDGPDGSGADALRILGSRFFGAAVGQSGASGSSESGTTANQPRARSKGSKKFELKVAQTSLVLNLPVEAETGNARQQALNARVLDLYLRVDPSHGALSTLSNLRVSSVAVDRFDGLSRRAVLTRTLPAELTNSATSMISVHVLSLAEEGTSYRESKVDVVLRDFTLVACPPTDLVFLADLQKFARSPEGAFEHVEPNEMTRLSVRVQGASILILTRAALSERPEAVEISKTTSAHQVPAEAALVLGDVVVKTKLSPYAPRTNVKYALCDVRALITEKSLERPGGNQRPRTPTEHWRSRGFASLANLRELRGSVTLSSLTRPEVDVRSGVARLDVTMCADTLSIVTCLVEALHIASTEPVNKETSPVRHEGQILREMARPSGSATPGSAGSDSNDSQDLLASLDQDAFLRREQGPFVDSAADLVDDDVPRNAGFLGVRARSPEYVATALQDDDDLLSEASLETVEKVVSPTSGDTSILFQNEAVTARALDARGIRPVLDYFNDPNLSPKQGMPLLAFASSVRVRVDDCDVSLRLFSGYDRPSSEAAIEAEVRRVRKRLQKIKQMLDEGQTPDDSVEDAAGSLFDSILLAPSAPLHELDADAAIQTLDDQVDDRLETSFDTSAWEAFPAAKGADGAKSGNSAKPRGKLKRSRHSMIDIEVRGIEAEYDAYGHRSPLASRLAVNARMLQILDNIKTSTWNTFLTKMQIKTEAHREHADSRMLRLEVRNVRSLEGGFKAPEQEAPRSTKEEARVRAKLAPLRLHVDQDALDFFKKFFAWKPIEAGAAPANESTASSEPFIQHAEIYPIRLKLDYKPKRVDYGLLRAGKTIEMMNFFHFDGAEMTLRHVTLRGITGWPRFFDTLNDIWTPDVKANQLADVLSGIAPVRSVVNLGAGVADLILLPIEQYQRDGRLARGLQKGAASFAKTTALEALKLGSKLATGTQVILERAEQMLGGSTADSETVFRTTTVDQANAAPADSFFEEGEDATDALSSSVITLSPPEDKSAPISRYAEAPEDLRQALSEAYGGLSKGFSSAAKTILAIPMEVHERESGSSGSSKPVIRAVPIAILKGAAGTSGALGKTLMGLQREVEGDLYVAEEKYKSSSARKGKEKRR